MTTAAVDVLGFLPGPVSKSNAGAADLLAGELFAYAVSSGVAVVDVRLLADVVPEHAIYKTKHKSAVLMVYSCLGILGSQDAAQLRPAWRTQERCYHCNQMVSMLQYHAEASTHGTAISFCVKQCSTLCRAPECFSRDPATSSLRCSYHAICASRTVQHCV